MDKTEKKEKNNILIQELIDDQILFWLATSKEITYLLMQLMGFNVQLQDPEEGNKERNIPEEEEPDSGNAFEAVIFKLSRIALLVDNLKKALAADVVYSLEGHSFSKFIRSPEDEKDIEGKTIDALQAFYLLYSEEEFEPTWDVVFGAYDEGVKRMGKVQLKAKVPPIEKSEIRKRLNLYSNAGIEMIEYLEDNNIPVFLVDEFGTEHPVDSGTVKQLVVYKMPTIAMLEKLLTVEDNKKDTNGEEVRMIFGKEDLDDRI